jgi:hypothetical protein
MASAMRVVADGTPNAAALALNQLIAPAQETLGPPVADALASAAGRARRAAG